MRIIIEIDDDLVQAQVVELTRKEKDRETREKLKAYFQEHTEVILPEEVATEFEEDFPLVMAMMAIGLASKDLNL